MSAPVGAAGARRFAIDHAQSAASYLEAGALEAAAAEAATSQAWSLIAANEAAASAERSRYDLARWGGPR